MKINVTLKDEQKEFLDQVINDYSLKNSGISIKSLVSEILDNYDHENVFGEIRCIGGCFSTDQSIEVELEDETVSKIKDIFQKYDFDAYDSEEEEISKIIRSMINFSEEEENIKKIFTS